MTGTISYRNEIDGLRAIAVGSVILNHFDHVLVPSGYLGVDIFFVISGYVISLSLCAREFGSLKEFLLGFYARRFKRLMPALILCVAVTAVLTSLFNSVPGESLKTGLFALFGLSNLYLLRVANDYFGGPSQLNSFTHTWSLGVEEQFYVIFPLILWLILRNKAIAGLAVLRIVMIAGGVLSLALFVSIGLDRPMVAFYLMPLRFWELAAGCLVAMVHTERGRPTRTQSRWAENLLVVLILVTLFTPQRLALPANIAVVALTAASLSILSPGSLAYRSLTSRPAAYIGIISYSLYLWHWPVLVLSRFTVGVHWWTIPILGGLIFLSAGLSYHKLERPLRTRPWAATNSRTVLWGGAAAGVAAVFVAILVKPLDGRLYAGQPARLSARNVESLSYPYHMPGTPYSWAGGNCVLTSDADAAKILPLEPCTLGNFRQATRRVMVFGNSFSAAFVQGFDTLVKDDHYAVTITSAWGAWPIGGMPKGSDWPQSNARYWNGIVPAMVANLRQGDWVMLVSDMVIFTPEQRIGTERRDLALYRTGLIRFSQQLDRQGVRLAVLDATPFIRDAYCRPETALPQWFAPAGGPCKFFSRADTIIRRRPVDALLRQLQAEHRLVVIDALGVFCPGQTCTFLGNGNQVLYRDELSHPSVEAVRQVSPLIRQVLTARPIAP